MLIGPLWSHDYVSWNVYVFVVQYSSEEEEEDLDDALSRLNKKKKVKAYLQLLWKPFLSLIVSFSHAL